MTAWTMTILRAARREGADRLVESARVARAAGRTALAADLADLADHTKHGSTMQKSIADRILDTLLGGDGRARKTRLGVDRYALAARIGRTVRDGLDNVIGFTFADGSEIEVCGDGWDTPAGWAKNT